MISNISNNFNYAGLLATGGGGTTTVSIEPDIRYFEEYFITATGFTVPNDGLGNLYSHARHGGGLVHVALRTNQPESLPINPVNVKITMWSSDVHNPTVVGKNYFPTHQELEFTPQQVYTRSMYNTAPQSNMIATSLRITHKYYFFTIDNRGDCFVNADYNIWICHSIHRSV